MSLPNNFMESADLGLQRLRHAAYFGRMLILGHPPSGSSSVQIYALSGRSANSRNRVLCADGGKVWTEAANPAEIEDPSLIIYTAMNERDGMYVVSNGDQTDTVINFGLDRVHEALNTREYEPDKPNFTPRITGVSIRAGEFVKHCDQEISILRRLETGECGRSFHRLRDLPGLGACITTYTGEDINPLPAFVGEPYFVPIPETIEETVAMYRDALARTDHFIALAVKFIDHATGDSEVQIVNRYTQVG